MVSWRFTRTPTPAPPVQGKPLLPGIGRYGPQQSGTASESARSSQQDPGAGLGSAEAHRVGAGTGSAVGSGLGTNLGGSANPCCPATGHYLTHQYHSPDYQAAQQEQQWQKAVQREAKPQCRQGLLLLVPSTSGPLADEEGAQLTPTDMGALTSCVQALRSGLEQLMAGMVEPPENPCRSPAAQPGAGEAGEGGVPPSAAAAKGPTDALHTPEQEQQQQRALVLALMQHVQQLERHLLPSARTPSQDSVELSGTAAAPGTVTPGEALGANHDGARPTGDAASLMDVDNPRDIHSSMVLLGTPLNMSVQDGVLPPFPAHTHVPQPTEVSGRAMQCDAVGEERAGSADGDAGAGKVSPVKPSEEGAGTPGRRVASIHAVTYDSSSAGGSSTTVAEATAPATSKHTPFADTANAAAAPEAGAGAEPVGQHPSPAPAHTQPAEQGMATPDKTSPHRHRHHMSPQDRAALRRLASHSPLAVGAGALRLPRAATLPSASGMSDGSSVLASPGALPPTGTVPSRSPGAAAAAGPVDRTSFGNPIDNPLYARTPTASEATAGALLAPTVHTEPHMAERPRHRSPFAGHALRYGDEDGTEEEGQQQHGEQQPGSGELPDIGVSDSLDLGRLRHGMQASGLPANRIPRCEKTVCLCLLPLFRLGAAMHLWSPSLSSEAGNYKVLDASELRVFEGGLHYQPNSLAARCCACDHVPCFLVTAGGPAVHVPHPAGPPRLRPRRAARNQRLPLRRRQPTPLQPRRLCSTVRQPGGGRRPARLIQGRPAGQQPAVPARQEERQVLIPPALPTGLKVSGARYLPTLSPT